LDPIDVAVIVGGWKFILNFDSGLLHAIYIFNIVGLTWARNRLPKCVCHPNFLFQTGFLNISAAVYSVTGKLKRLGPISIPELMPCHRNTMAHDAPPFLVPIQFHCWTTVTELLKYTENDFYDPYLAYQVSI